MVKFDKEVIVTRLVALVVVTDVSQRLCSEDLSFWWRLNNGE
jgi:hypothetical protein